MKKQIILYILLLSMIMTLLPAVVMAKETDLYIGSTKVIFPEYGKYTYGHNDDHTGITAETLHEIPDSATWYLRWDDDTYTKYTLTLRNFSYSGTGYNYSAIYSDGNLTIELIDENNIQHEGSSSVSSFGIQVLGGSLTIQGSGSLSVSGGNVTGAGISSGIMTPSGVTIKGSAQVNTTGSDLTREDSSIFGILVLNGKITIKGTSQVIATGGNALLASYGLAGVSISIEDNANVKAVAGTAQEAQYGILADYEGLKVTGGTTLARGDTSAIYVYLSRDSDTNNDSLITIDSDMLVTGSTDINDDIKNFIEARFSDDNSKVQIGDEDAKAVLIAFPTFIAPNANIHNGIMASVSFDKNSPQIVGTEVTVTVTLMGVAEAEGTHSVSLTGIKANLSGAEQTVTVTAGQNLNTTILTETFIMPAKHVDDLVLTHSFVSSYVPPTPSYDPGPLYTYYLIKASAGMGGNITSDGNIAYREGQDQRFIVTSDKGYLIFDVLVDGMSVGPVNEYSFTNIQEHHTIEAVFVKGDMESFKMAGEYTGYPDMDEGKWYGTEDESVVRNATLLGIMEGDGTNFRPEDMIKLSEVVKIAAFMHNTYYGNPYSFDQTTGTHWYDTYVDFAIKYGIIKADDFTDYDRNATRAEMAYILAHALPESEFSAISSLIPPDVAETDPYAA